MINSFRSRYAGFREPLVCPQEEELVEVWDRFFIQSSRAKVIGEQV